MRTLIFLLTLFLSLLPADAASDRSPNIIVVFMDDMGYADIGPFGAKAYPTPNFDRMAKEGRKFTGLLRNPSRVQRLAGGVADRLLQRARGHPLCLGPATRTALTPAK